MFSMALRLFNHKACLTILFSLGSTVSTLGGKEVEDSYIQILLTFLGFQAAKRAYGTVQIQWRGIDNSGQ